MRTRLAAELKRPAKFREQACRASAVAHTEQTLVLGSEDARLEPRHLIPMDLQERLVGSDLKFSRLVSHFASNGPPPSSLADAQRELSELELLSKRRFKGVYYVTDYGSPKLIHRPNRLRAEWIPGVLAAWFVIHDLENGEALCQTQLIVRNDVKDEPISRRMKSDVRARLIRELALEMRQRTETTLTRSGLPLKLPSS